MSARPRAFLEVGALFEEHWTGIPNVAAAIAADALRDPAIDWSFVFDDMMLPSAMIEQFLRARSGLGGLKLLSELAWDNRSVPPAVAQGAACIFPNIKPVRRLFGREASIVHDLSAMITPQFHNTDTIHHVADRFRMDMATSDHVFCVSRATMADVNAYFRVPFERMSLLPLGVDVDPVHVSAARIGLRRMEVEPYVAVVGTLEPRKNGRLVFQYLEANPEFASRHQIVFIGRDGWLGEKSRLLDAVRAAGVSPDRIIFTGFVSEAEKTALMLNSRFCIYPSFFEGFGLPILEAATLGKITVCSNSSSMPEVCPDKCIFFDPNSVDEFADAMAIAERRAGQTRSANQALPEIMARTEANGWSRCYPEVARWILNGVAA